eukprot:c20330_g1_i1.p1 GENE.c20330_g1_i1~~c20330_g1_i1.p1  ORF type:complete len:475 (+),score=214.14 c20330_g1_i1:40-1464(+)
MSFFPSFLRFVHGLYSKSWTKPFAFLIGGVSLPFISLFVLVSPWLMKFLLIELPKPRGKFSVGNRDVEWKIKSKTGSKLIRVHLFYPCEATTNTGEQPQWLPSPASLYAPAHGKAVGIPTWISSHVSGFLFNIKMPTIQNSKIHSPPTNRGFPVIIFSHGLFGCSTTYSSLCAELASHGFFVVAIEHKDGTAVVTSTTDGEVVPYVTEASYIAKAQKDEPNKTVDELRFRFRNDQVKERAEEIGQIFGVLVDLNKKKGGDFFGCLDLAYCAVVGHSFGGATTIESCAFAASKLNQKKEEEKNELQFNPYAAIALDSWMFPVSDSSYEIINNPVMFLNTKSLTTDLNMGRINRVMSTLSQKQDKSIVIEVSDTFHQDQSDIPLLLYWVYNLFGFIGKRHPENTLRLNFDLCLGYLLYHLPDYVRKDKSDDYAENVLKQKSIQTIENLLTQGRSFSDDYIVHTWITKGVLYKRPKE